MMTHEELIGTWDYTTLPANVRLGHDCFLQDRSSFGRFRSRRDPGLTIADRVIAYHWTAFTVEPEGLLEIGEDTTLVGPIFWCNHHIRIGRRVLISYNVMIADSDFHPRDPVLRRQDAMAIAPGGDRSRRPEIVSRPVIIEDDVWVGIGAIILKGVTIGKGARVGAGAVVSRNVSPGGVVAGNPARPEREGETL